MLWIIYGACLLINMTQSICVCFYWSVIFLSKTKRLFSWCDSSAARLHLQNNTSQKRSQSTVKCITRHDIISHFLIFLKPMREQLFGVLLHSAHDSLFPSLTSLPHNSPPPDETRWRWKRHRQSEQVWLLQLYNVLLQYDNADKPHTHSCRML